MWGGERGPWIERSSKDLSTELQQADFEAVGRKQRRKVFDDDIKESLLLVLSMMMAWWSH